MSAVKIAAFDLSLTSTGYAKNTDPVRGGILTPPTGRDRGVERLCWIRDSIISASRGVDLVVIEGYSFSSKGNSIVSLAELGGVVRVALTEHGRTWITIPPASVKLFATGKGNAGKDQVLAEAIRKLNYAGHSNDEADALWLLTMARTHYGQGATNEHGRRALAKVDWPSLTTTEVAP